MYPLLLLQNQVIGQEGLPTGPTPMAALERAADQSLGNSRRGASKAAPSHYISRCEACDCVYAETCTSLGSLVVAAGKNVLLQLH